MKKFISILACSAMLATSAPIGAMAQSNIVTLNEGFSAGSEVFDRGTIAVAEESTTVGTVSVTNKVPVFTQDFTNVTEDSRLTDAGKTTASYNSNLTITTTAQTAQYYYDISDVTKNRDDYSVEMDLTVSEGYIDLGLRYVVRIYSDGYMLRKDGVVGYEDKVAVDFTTAKKVKFVVSNKENDKDADVSLYIDGVCVQEKMNIPIDSKGAQVSYGSLNKFRIDSAKAQTITIDNMVIEGSPLDGNIIKMEKTGTTATQSITVIPSKAELCKAKNYTIEFDMIPLNFSGSGQISLAMGSKYTVQATNSGAAIQKLKVNEGSSANMTDCNNPSTSINSIRATMENKSHVKIEVKDGNLTDLYFNGYKIAENAIQSTEGWSFDKLRIQMNRSTTGTLYLDNFKLTLMDDYLLSSEYDGENFNVNYYIKDAAKLYKASYDGEGMIKNVEVEMLEASAAEEITTKGVAATEDVASMSFFIWNSEMVPLVNSASSRIKTAE